MVNKELKWEMFHNTQPHRASCDIKLQRMMDKLANCVSQWS